MSENYPESEWEVINGVRYRKESIDPKTSKKMKVKAKDIVGEIKEVDEVPKGAKVLDEVEIED